MLWEGAAKDKSCFQPDSKEQRDSTEPHSKVLEGLLMQGGKGIDREGQREWSRPKIRNRRE